MGASDWIVLGGIGLLGYYVLKQQESATGGDANSGAVAGGGGSSSTDPWAILPDGTVIGGLPDNVIDLLAGPTTPEGGPWRSTPLPAPVVPQTSPPPATPGSPRLQPTVSLEDQAAAILPNPTIAGAGGLAGFLNAFTRPVPRTTALPPTLRGSFGGAPAIGAAIGGAQAIGQGVIDLQNRQRGTGPYAHLNAPASTVAGVANVAAGAAVGAGSFGLATLDFNRGVTFFGLPVVQPVYRTSATATNVGFQDASGRFYTRDEANRLAASERRLLSPVNRIQENVVRTNRSSFFGGAFTL